LCVWCGEMWKLGFGKKSGVSPTRSPRFDLEFAINYRKRGEFSWNMGKTCNISRSGVFFRAVQGVGPASPLEIEFVAPKEFGPEAGELLSCRGEVVRAIPPPPDDRRISMAAKFSKIHVLRRPGEW
jgi:hypothetical protein